METSLTTIVVVIAVCALSLFDIVVLTKNGIKATISYLLFTSAQKYPAIPFALGFLMGHLFWTMCELCQ